VGPAAVGERKAAGKKRKRTREDFCCSASTIRRVRVRVADAASRAGSLSLPFPPFLSPSLSCSLLSLAPVSYAFSLSARCSRMNIDRVSRERAIPPILISHRHSRLSESQSRNQSLRRGGKFIRSPAGGQRGGQRPICKRASVGQERERERERERDGIWFTFSTN